MAELTFKQLLDKFNSDPNSLTAEERTKLDSILDAQRGPTQKAVQEEASGFAPNKTPVQSDKEFNTMRSNNERGVITPPAPPEKKTLALPAAPSGDLVVQPGLMPDEKPIGVQHNPPMERLALPPVPEDAAAQLAKEFKEGKTGIFTRAKDAIKENPKTAGALLLAGAAGVALYKALYGDKTETPAATTTSTTQTATTPVAQTPAEKGPTRIAAQQINKQQVESQQIAPFLKLNGIEDADKLKPAEQKAKLKDLIDANMDEMKSLTAESSATYDADKKRIMISELANNIGQAVKLFGAARSGAGSEYLTKFMTEKPADFTSSYDRALAEKKGRDVQAQERGTMEERRAGKANANWRDTVNDSLATARFNAQQKLSADEANLRGEETLGAKKEGKEFQATAKVDALKAQQKSALISLNTALNTKEFSSPKNRLDVYRNALAKTGIDDQEVLAKIQDTKGWLSSDPKEAEAVARAEINKAYAARISAYDKFMGKPQAAQTQAEETKLINGVKYKKVPGGWQKVQ